MRIFLIVLAILSMSCTAKHEAPKKIPPAPTPPPNLERPPGKKPKACKAKPAVVAVIDTGFNYPQISTGVNLCKFGHRNFTSNVDEVKISGIKDPVPVDHHGHGTNVTGIIQEYAKNSYYCMVIIKYYDPKAMNNDNLENTIKAIKYARNIGADYINYSGGGLLFDSREKDEIQKFLDKGGRFIAAAGNERSDIKKLPYYPAMYDSRIVSVGSIEKDGSVAMYSNYGEGITRWEYGTNIVGFGIIQSGTSQATATATGKIINESECDK